MKVIKLANIENLIELKQNDVKGPCFIGTRTMYNSKRSRIITGNDNVPVKTNRQNKTYS